MSGPPSRWDEVRFRRAVAAAGAHQDRTGQLLELLDEAYPAYAECSSIEVARRRGWLLLELGKAALPTHALPVVLEPLGTGHEAYLLAAAARTLRAAPAPSESFYPRVLRAVDTLSRRNDLVDLETWGGHTDAESGPTALDEAVKTLAWLGPPPEKYLSDLRRLAQAPGIPLKDRQTIQALLKAPAGAGTRDGTCCALEFAWRRRPPGRPAAARTELIRFEDHNGASRTWSEVFAGQPTLAAFFYTRCENPEKCSLTVTKLAHVQRLVAAAGFAAGVRIAAITYDGDYDVPARLRVYATDRGLQLGEQCLMLRAIAGADDLRRAFESGVNFVGTLVNWHRIEVFILDTTGHPTITYQRLEWDPVQVVEDLREVMTTPSTKATHANAAEGTAHATSALLALFLALLPKCPVCGATYLSLTGIAAIPYMDGWVAAWPVALVLLIINVAIVALMARKGRRWAPVAVAAAGALIIAGPGLALGSEVGTLLGLALTSAGSLLSVFSVPRRDWLAQASDAVARARARTLVAIPRTTAWARSRLSTKFTVTAYPSRARRLATAAPIPRDEPVTMAAFPVPLRAEAVPTTEPAASGAVAAALSRLRRDMEAGC